MGKVGTAVQGVLYSSRTSKEGAKTRVAILLHCAGPEAQDIHSNFVFSDTEGYRANDYNSVLKKFKECCEPRNSESDLTLTKALDMSCSRGKQSAPKNYVR